MSPVAGSWQMSQRNTVVLVWGLCLCFSGCGKELKEGFAEVYGTVMFDGEPLENCRIEFVGDHGTSYGRTDASGNYQMEYSQSMYGAPVGETRVSITSAVVFRDDDPNAPPKTEIVPEKYRGHGSELVLEVAPDGAPYNFELTSE